MCKGIVKGRYTIGAIDTQSASAGRSSSTITSRYNTDPRTNPASTDMLGIVANRNITIADNTATGGGPNFTVMAALFSYAGAIEVENLDTRNLGTLYTYGGWTVNDIYATTNSGDHQRV